MVDIYLRLAELNIRQGEFEKAEDLLNQGYEVTGDRRLCQEVKEQQPELSFKDSESYQTFDSLSESGQQSLRKAVAAIQQNNRDAIYEALIDSGLPVFLRTEMDGMRIDLTFVDDGSLISLEIRPEQGEWLCI